MCATPPTHGRWRHLAEAWQLELWGDAPWYPGDLRGCIAQLRAIGDVAPNHGFVRDEALRIRDALVALLEEAAHRSAKVRFERD